MSDELQAVPNIFSELPGYNCVACAPHHEWGFRLRFFRRKGANEVVSLCNGAAEDMAGFPGILHGGFQAMLLDEVQVWAALGLAGRLCFTARLEVAFVRPVVTDRPLTLRGSVLEDKGRRIQTRGEIVAGEYGPDGAAPGEVLARATASLHAPTREEFAAIVERAGTRAEIPERLGSWFRG